MLLPLRRAHHAPTHDGGSFERAEDEPLEHEADGADDGKGGHHDIGIQKFLGIENNPTKSPVRCGEHLGAHHSDPRSQERLPHPVMMKADAPGIITFQNSARSSAPMAPAARSHSGLTARAPDQVLSSIGKSAA